MRLRLNFLLCVVGSLLLAACTPPAEQPDASVAISSPAAGTTVVGARTVTVTAALTDAVEAAEIEARVNDAVVSHERVGSTITFEAQLADHHNVVSVSVKNPKQLAPAVSTIDLDYPFITLTTHQPATLAIGQVDLVSATEAADERRFLSPYGRPAIVNGVLYLPDYGLGRLMGYDSLPTLSGASADFVLGKADFADADDTVAAARMAGPQTVESDGQRLFVSDYEHNRILVFDGLPTSDGAAAAYAIGQPDLESSTGTCSATGLESPESFTLAAGKLIVADSDNNRVLIWNSVPSTSGTAADVVLGQSTFDSCVENDDDQDGAPDAGPSARTLFYPSDVWSDGERLVVVDSDNLRVLIWNEFPTTSFEGADLVLGQADFTSDDALAGASGFEYPYFLHSNGNQLFVTDTGNHRVLVWNSMPTENAQPADVVIGQADFDGTASDAGEAVVNASGLSRPTGVYAHGNQLFVADNDNERYLVYGGANP